MTSSSAPICVTGASGFIASHLVGQLLAKGYRVRGTVRNPASAKDTAHLRALEGARERLELVGADLLDAAAFDGAVAGCEVVMHTASPYALTVRDPQKDLVDPALRGTLNVLEACDRAGGVKRVVLTSSVAAITDEPPPRAVTEADWNETSALDRNPYYFSKVVAESAAWKFMQGNKGSKRSFDLVVINPFLVVGPSLTPTLNTSNRVLVDLVTGAYPGILSLGWGFVDVRDVARAHVLAMETPYASGRYICAHVTLEMRALVAKLSEMNDPRFKLPSLGLDGAIGTFLVRLGARFQPKGVGDFLRTNLGRVPYFDNAKIRRDFDFVFTDFDQTLRDAYADLRRWGHLKA